MKYIFPLLIFFNASLFAQNGVIKGNVKDANTGEAVIGASVSYAPGKGVVTDIDGNYLIKIDSSGQYTITISYIGYDAQSQKINVGSKALVINFSMQSQTLNEVEVVADVAKIRVTPIAFSNVSLKQIQEELGTRDMPMILNSTPGTYATEQGGGSGDSRITIRGFDQRNVALLIDGVPMNDMENGQVYWSNWDGLIPRTIQVQRGLGASKLAIPSVGGTINIISLGIDEKMGAQIKQEVNDYGLYRTSFGFNSGQMKKKWGVTLSASRKWGNEWPDGTFTDAWSFYGKIQKRFDKHLLSLSGSVSPQSHGQRYDRLPVGIYSKKFSDKLGINTDSIYQHTTYTTFIQGERGLTYNPNWGTLDSGNGTSDGKIHFFQKSKQGEIFNERVNYFIKPQVNLSHFWSPNEKLTVSTVLYLSIGHGGGTALKGGVGKDSTNGLLSVQSVYDHNSSPAAIYLTYSKTEHASSNYLRSANNNHIWYGAITSWNYKINQNISTLFGIDARSYKGTHYQSIYNLMGGDYAIDNTSNLNQPKGTFLNDPNLQFAVKRVGDKTVYYNDSKVYWGGMFAQAEYKKDKWSAFFTTSFSETGYQRIDYFKRKDLVIDGNTFSQAVGWGDTMFYNGAENVTALFGSVITTSGDTTFIKNPGKPKVSIINATQYSNESAEARFSTTDRKWFSGYTFKGGTNYNVNDFNNVFINLGYLNMAPRMNVVFDNNNKPFAAIQNQKVYAVECGYGLKRKIFAANLNLYYTLWKNRPPDYTPTVTTPDGILSYNINGMDELHKGVELDFIVKIIKNLEFEGVASFGDWKTISGTKVYVTNDAGVVVDSVDFSAKNVHVGNAAQIQTSGSLRYSIIKGLYVKPRFTYFAKNYANFDPTTLIGTNKDRESWKMPDYGLLDFYAGYNLKIWKMNMGVSAGIVNVLNTVYISDAQNGSKFNATSALVYMGMGRRINVALKIEF